MPEMTSLLIYVSAAFVFAITPGPGMLYVLTRSLKGGRVEGYASSIGTGIGGLFHVFAAAVGISAILATSALLFGIVKMAGAAYLVYLGVRTIFGPDAHTVDAETMVLAANPRDALRQGIIAEGLNPKTAIFFLAFIPQFVSPDALVFTQFLILGGISVVMNTASDVVVATLAGPIGTALRRHVALRRAQRIATGTGLIGLGAYVAVSGEGSA